MTRSTRLGLLLALLALLLPIGVTPAGAQPSRAPERYAEAFQLFETLAAEQLPQLGQPGTQRMFDILFDRDRLLRTTASAGSENALTQNRLIIRRYLWNGVTADRASPELVDQMNRNMVRYQDEIFPLLALQGDLLALMLRGARELFAGPNAPEITQIRRQGLAQMRQGLANVISGAAQTATESQTRVANSVILLDVVLINSGEFVAALTLAERQQLIASVRGHRANARTETIERLDELIRKLEDANCTGLCAF